MYALLTGHPPFIGGSTHEIIKQIRQNQPEIPRKFQLAIPELFEGLVLRMLAKQPEKRHQTPTELLEDLDRVAKFQGMTTAFT